MSSYCSFCGSPQNRNDLRNIPDNDFDVITKLQEAFSVDLDASKFSEICTTCEEKVEVCYQFYQQILKSQQTHACFIKEEVQEKTTVKVELELDDYRLDVPDFCGDFSDFDDQIPTNCESGGDQKPGCSSYEGVFSSSGRSIKPPNLFSHPVKPKPLKKSKLKKISKIPQHPMRPTDKPGRLITKYVRKGEPGYKPKGSRGVRKPKVALALTMPNIFDDEIQKKKFYDQTETIPDVKNPRVWSDYTWTCSECEANFDNIYDLNLHLNNWHTKKLDANCIQCLKKNANFASNINHTLSHHPHLKFCCVICSKMHQSLMNLFKHQQSAHKNYKILFCLYCGVHSVSGSWLYDHVILKHNRVNERVLRYHCDFCGFEALTKSQITLHMRRHMAVKMFQCDQCEKAYVLQYTLKNHILTEHSDSEPQEICSQCGLKFMTFRSLKRHIETSHLKIRNFPCEVCKKRFYSRGSLKSHMYTHDKTAVGDLPCPMCPRLFKRKTALEYHIRVHTGEKPFCCPSEGCGYRAIDFPNALKHIKVVHKSDAKPIKVSS